MRPKLKWNDTRGKRRAMFEDSDVYIYRYIYSVLIFILTGGVRRTG